MVHESDHVGNSPSPTALGSVRPGRWPTESRHRVLGKILFLQSQPVKFGAALEESRKETGRPEGSDQSWEERAAMLTGSHAGVTTVPWA